MVHGQKQQDMQTPTATLSTEREAATSSRRQESLHKESPEEAVRHLRTLMKSFSTAMLNTRSDDNHLRSRPMAVIIPEDEANEDVVYFATTEDSYKVDNIRKDNHVNLAFQSSSCWVSVCATAELVKDRRMLEKVWTESMNIWFPQGLSTPSLVLIKCRLHSGEYWDQSSLTDKVKFYYETGMAYLQGRSAQPSMLGTHEKVQLTA